MTLGSQKTAVAWLSVFSNTALVIFKLSIGLIIGSVSVISEAIHSGVDLLASVIAVIAVGKSNEPADEDHPYGHGKFENISGTIEAILIFFAAAWIIYEAVHKLIVPKQIGEPSLGVMIMGISSIVNFVVSQMLFKVARKTDSVALEADAWHLRTDVYTSAGVMVGLLLIWVGKKIYPDVNLSWIDPVTAIIVALLIVQAAYDLTKKSARDLVDTGLPPEDRKWLHDYIKEMKTTHSQMSGYHKLRTRKSGAQIFIDFHLLVDGQMSVEKSHQMTDEMRDAIRRRFSNASVLIHTEPCRAAKSNSGLTSCHLCKEGCFLVK